MQPLLTFVTALLLYSCPSCSAQGVRIIKPAHYSVVRTQSVEIDIESDFCSIGGLVVITLDGTSVGQIAQSGRVSLILADEAVVGEGVHEVNAAVLNAEGKVVVSHLFIEAHSAHEPRTQSSCCCLNSFEELCFGKGYAVAVLNSEVQAPEYAP